MFALFLGRWTDLHGTKIPMLFSIGGNWFQLICLYISSFNKSWNAQTVALLACVPVALTGSQISFNLCLHSYIADTNASSDSTIRMIRIGIANAAWLVGSSLGLALGGVMAKYFDISAIFGTAVGLELFCFMGVLCFVSNTRRADQDNNLVKVLNYRKLGEIVLQNVKQLFQGMKSVFRKREDSSGRLKIVLMVATLFLTIGLSQGNSSLRKSQWGKVTKKVVVIPGETNVMYFFVREQVNWSASEFGIYGTYKSLLGSVGEEYYSN